MLKKKAYIRRILLVISLFILSSCASEFDEASFEFDHSSNNSGSLSDNDTRKDIEKAGAGIIVAPSRPMKKFLGAGGQ